MIRRLITPLPLTTLRVGPAGALLVTGLFLLAAPARAALPDYKLGEVAWADVTTPLPLVVANPEATEELTQQLAEQVPAIVRFFGPSVGEAEAELRAGIVAARSAFMAALRQALHGRAPTGTDVGSFAYTNTIREVIRQFPKNPPIARLAPLWVRGASDAAMVDNLLRPVREVMARPIVADDPESMFLADQPLRLVPGNLRDESPPIQKLPSTGEIILIDKMMSLARAGRQVEADFPAGQEDLGRFAASFVRVNAWPAPKLTDFLRAKRMQGVTVNDTYAASEFIVRKGRTIDRKALNALAALREKIPVLPAQIKSQPSRSTTAGLSWPTPWIAGGLGVIGVMLGLMVRRGRAKRGSVLVEVSEIPARTRPTQPVWPEVAGEDNWRARTRVAEVKPDRAHEAIHNGALGWMRAKIFQTLFQQRAELLSSQQKTEVEMRELEKRLERLHAPLQERLTSYEKRIDELEQDLAAKSEENRELIGARIDLAKQQLGVERGRFGTN